MESDLNKECAEWIGMRSENGEWDVRRGEDHPSFFVSSIISDSAASPPSLLLFSFLSAIIGDLLLSSRPSLHSLISFQFTQRILSSNRSPSSFVSPSYFFSPLFLLSRSSSDLSYTLFSYPLYYKLPSRLIFLNWYHVATIILIHILIASFVSWKLLYSISLIILFFYTIYLSHFFFAFFE